VWVLHIVVEVGQIGRTEWHFGVLGVLEYV